MTDWRKISIWLLAGGIVVCGWCSLLSGVAGWWQGYELGYREARVAFLPETGVLVTRLDRDGPAAMAGIAPGDTIIALNGVLITDVPMLHTELLRYQPEQEIQITFRRKRTEQTTFLVLNTRPGSNPPLPYLGVYYTARADKPADI
jgi:C-terminal processing protease CtpA/Prc